VGTTVANRLVIFMWHNVEGTWCYPSPPGMGVRSFEYQLRRLRQLTTVVPLQDALEALATGRPLPHRAVAVTFDDGYRDNLELAAPLLERLAIPATFFLVPGLLSGNVRPWWETLGWAFTRAKPAVLHWDGRVLPTRGRQAQRSFRWLSERLKLLDLATREQRVDELLSLLEPDGRADEGRLFLDWDGARQLVRRGFAVGSHSMRHAILSREAPEQQARDLISSRRQLEAELDIPVDLLAYPNGTRADYDEHTIHAAAQAGHTHALAAHAGVNGRSTSPYAHPRFFMEPHRGFLNMVLQRVRYRLHTR
jgi:peptidoglycan/xylan/chitin deacetylase (PgdA/CDA1 family)